MPKENPKESAAAEKAGQAPPEVVPAKGEPGSEAHALEGAQANEFTAEAVASLLKSDLTEAVGEPEPEEQTPPAEGDPADPAEGEEKEKPDEKVKGPERPEVPESRTAAQAEVEGWKEAIADLEAQVEAAQGDEKTRLLKELNAAKADLTAWEKIASGPEVVPEALGLAIKAWKEKGGGELPPELQELVEDRIHKATSQRDAERTAREAAEAKVTELEARLSAGTGTGVGVPTKAELAQEEKNGNAIIDDLESVLDGAADEAQTQRVAKLVGSEYLDSPEAQRAMKRQLRHMERYMATEHENRKKAVDAFEKQEASMEPKAREWFPFLYDKSHPDYAEAQGVLQVMPGLTRLTPAHRFALGAYVLGLRELRRLHPEAFAKEKGVFTPKALPRKAPPRSPVSGGNAAAPNGAKTRARAVEEVSARAEFDKRPNAESARKLLKIGLRAA